jgi:hypothetical protein
MELFKEAAYRLKALFSRQAFILPVVNTGQHQNRARKVSARLGQVAHAASPGSSQHFRRMQIDSQRSPKSGNDCLRTIEPFISRIIERFFYSVHLKPPFLFDRNNLFENTINKVVLSFKAICFD